ncbi:DUF1236 domain-containing protein [Phyllobacterium sp. 0TCS1.6C]|nr:MULTISPECIES: DUF1236 domain-containing protein [unclassified Phyllobacterium]MCX8279994.1 DUF1236 domain-containing protein [Phyllobacterium sp. 0TCS1.6C]MCX8296161.1 DUF1236 domain-containing protein [Phyllobacterium sp. 0TCS1.6A]
MAVGSTLPETAELHTLDVPEVNDRYVIVDGQTVLGEPATRKIARIIK